MVNNLNNKKVEDYPLDSLILYSLREFSNGNIEIAENLHNIFQLKIKESLKEAQKLIQTSDHFKADSILANIAKAKIAQSEWLYLANERSSQTKKFDDKESKQFILLNDIYEDLILPNDEFKKRQDKKLLQSYFDKNYESTSNRAKQLFLISPYNQNYHKFYGISQIKIGNSINAIKAFENALKFNPKSPELLFYMGKANFKSGIISHAELFIRKSLVLEGNSFEANKLLGEILILQKNYVEAEYYFSKAYRANKYSASVCANLSLCLFKQNKIIQGHNYAILSCQIDPNNHKFLNNLGIILKKMKLYGQAKSAFYKAIKISPDFGEAHNNLGTLLQFNDPDKAIYHYSIAKKDKGISFEVFLNTAAAYRQKEDHKLALKFAKQAIKINPNNAKCNKLMGVLYLDKGNFNKAKFHFKKTLMYNHYEPETIRLLSKISSLNFLEIRNLLKLLKENYFNKNDEKHILFLLADYFHHQSNYKKSWFYLRKANNLISKKNNYNFSQDIKRFSSIKVFFKKIKKETDLLNKKDKAFLFIVGMPRSGTTLIEQILSNSDDVYGGGEIEIIPKEIDKILSTKNKTLVENRSLNLIRSSYLNYISEKTNKSIIIDKMPYNFQNIGIIKSVFPSSKFIHVFRDPMDNSYSLYKTYFSNNNHPFTYDLKNIYNFHKLYQKYISFWKRFHKDIIFDIKYENLIQNPEEHIRKMISFCNLEWDDRFLQPHKNKKEVFTASAFQIRKKLNPDSIGIWKNYSQYLLGKDRKL